MVTSQIFPLSITPRLQSGTFLLIHRSCIRRHEPIFHPFPTRLTFCRANHTPEPSNMHFWGGLTLANTKIPIKIRRKTRYHLFLSVRDFMSTNCSLKTHALTHIHTHTQRLKREFGSAQPLHGCAWYPKRSFTWRVCMPRFGSRSSRGLLNTGNEKVEERTQRRHACENQFPHPAAPKT